MNFDAGNGISMLEINFSAYNLNFYSSYAVVPTGQFFVVLMIHEASRLSHLSPQFIKKIFAIFGRGQARTRVAGSEVGRSTDYAIEPVMGIVLLWLLIYLICLSLVM